MSWMWTALAVFVLVPGLAMAWNRVRVRREYRRAVGLELRELTSLLPDDLRDREYTSLIPRISVFILALSVGTACVTTSGATIEDLDVANLTPGSTTRSEVISRFGTPTFTATASAELLSYSQHKIRWILLYSEVVELRTLTVEIVDQRVRAYHLERSTNDSVEPPLNLAVAQLKPGRAHKSDFVSRLGAPSGRAVCPTVLFPSCAGREALFWGESNTPGGAVLVSFSEDGTAELVRTETTPGEMAQLPPNIQDRLRLGMAGAEVRGWFPSGPLARWEERSVDERRSGEFYGRVEVDLIRVFGNDPSVDAEVLELEFDSADTLVKVTGPEDLTIELTKD